MNAQRTVSLIGLGAMGLPMARRLSEARHLTVWNRSAEKAELVPQAQVAETLPDAAADIVITVLPDLDDVRTVLFDGGLLAGFARQNISEPIVVVCGTVSPVALRELAAELAERSVTVVDAPLSGGVLGAKDGLLSIMVGGAHEHFTIVADVLEPCARSVTHLGPTGAGATAKLCNQVVVAETVAALSEAFALARTAGIDPAVLADALSAGLANSEVLRQKRHHWIDETFEPGGTVDYQVKDLRYATELADEGGLQLEALRTARELFERSSAAGDGGLDHTGVYRVISAPRDETLSS